MQTSLDTRFSLEQKIAAHRTYIVGVAMGFTNDIHDAEDLAQDIILTVLSRPEIYREQGSFKKWIGQLVKNRFIDRFRKRGRKKRLEYHREGLTVQSDAPFNLAVGDIFNAIEKLPDDQIPIAEFYLVGYRTGEIANMTKQSIFSVRAKTQRIKKKIDPFIKESITK